jgi:hypothetical protein
VGVEHVDTVCNPYSCAGYQQLRIFTERIPLRLCDLRHLPLKYTIYIIKEAIIGFKAIFSHFGYLPISDNLIGFNSYSKVRVWVNSNFASNVPHTSYSIKQTCGKDESKMTSQLFESVENHTSQGADLQMFKAARVLLGDMADFDEASIFLSNYCIEHRILLPNKFEISALTQFVKPVHER